MGRGGGFHGGSHHSSSHGHYRSHRSHYHSHTTYHRKTTYHHTTTYHSSGTGPFVGASGGTNSVIILERKNVCTPFLVSLLFLFLFLASVAGFVLCIVFGDEDFQDSCTVVGTLNRNEQAYCKPVMLDQFFYAKFSKEAEGHAQVYLANEKSLPELVFRNYSWLNYHEKIRKDRFSYFSIASVYRVAVNVTVRMDAKENVEMYWLTSGQFENFVDDVGAAPDPVISSFDKGETHWEKSNKANDMFYLVFEPKEHTVEFSYDVAIQYTVYDVTNLTEANCSGHECVAEGMTESDVLIMDYPVESTSASQSSPGSDPEFFEMMFFVRGVNVVQVYYGTVWLAMAAVVFLLFFGSFLLKCHGNCDWNRYVAKQEKEEAEKREKELQKEGEKEVQMEVVVDPATPDGVSPATPGQTPDGVPPTTPDGVVPSTPEGTSAISDGVANADGERVEDSDEEDSDEEDSDEEDSDPDGEVPKTTEPY